MKIDKSDLYVNYNDENHKYWTKDTNENCISVTTLISKFDNFDEDFWSSYKTIEALLSVENFLVIKPILLKTKKFNFKLLDGYNIDQESFKETREKILKGWADKREASCIRGSAIHKEKELLNLGGSKELKKLGLGGSFDIITSNKLDLTKSGIYPEMLLSRISPDGKLRLAGQADLIINDYKDVFIIDYKTGEKIDQKSFYDRVRKKSSMMKYPLNNIQDCNFWHYTLQLSTYAWMIEKANPEANIKCLMLIHIDHNNKEVMYECEYRKNDVERMLIFYRKQIEDEIFKQKMKKV